MDPAHLIFSFVTEQFANSGADGGGRILRGHAAVYDRLSHDLGGFRTRILPGAFDAVLNTDPDVHLVIDHDTRYVMARTRNNTLELRSDPVGLHVWARLAPVSYVDDLEVLMDGGYVDQMSFACDIGKDTWKEEQRADGSYDVTRDIEEISALYDVTVCAQGAFPQTDSRLQADLASAIEAGRVKRPANAAATSGSDGDDAAAPNEEPDVADVAPPGVGSLVAVHRAQAADVRHVHS